MADIKTVVRALKQDYCRFCRLIKIRPKSGGLTRYIPRPHQLHINGLTNRRGARVKLTKARQLGFTTDLSVGALHYCLMNRGVKVGLAAHHARSAQEIFQIARTAYDNLPLWLRQLPQFREIRNSNSALQFGNGSSIMVGTANSEFWRGSTFQRMVLTEAAYYNSLQTTLTAVAQVVPDDGMIVLETTANGPNDWKDFWDQDNGYTGLFYSWLDDPGYQTDEPFAADPEQLLPYELDYIVTNNLPLPRANWFVKTLRQKCFSNMQVWNQEYPITAEVAFITSGSPFFPIQFQLEETRPDHDGWRTHKEFVPGHTYTCGIDAASGSPTGDFSFAVILDVTNPTKMEEVSTYRGRVDPATLAAEVFRQAIVYGALINPESNNHGTALIDALSGLGADMYKHVELVNGTRQVARQYGTEVTAKSRSTILMRLYRAIACNHLTVADDRTKQDLNAFMYNQVGRPEAVTGKHDDGVFALAHAVGCAGSAKPAVPKSKPLPPVPDRGLGMAGRLMYEISTGHLLTSDDYDDDPSPL